MAKRSLDLLKPKVKALTEEFIKKCEEKGHDVIITCTLRSEEEQNELYSIGRTKPGKKVTNAKGGYSFHNHGVAIDFAPVLNGKVPWNDTELFMTIGKIGESLGFEWGGSWKGFQDLPHLQYTAGYSIQDFASDTVDWSKFENNSISKLAERLKGRILLQVESHHEAWYVNPLDYKRYYLKDGEEALRIMKKFGLGITNSDLEQIKIGNIS